MRKATHRFRCLYLLIPLALVSMQLFGFFPCPPVMAAPVLSLVPSSGTVGTPVTITGTVFDSYEGDTIHILFDDTEISTIVIPSNGSFTISSTIPADAASGQHNIGAKRETTDSTFFISAPFTVDARALTLSAVEGPVGTDVTISGAGFYAAKAVDLTYENPASSSIDTITASGTGRFSKTFKIPSGTAGDHNFNAVNDVGNSANATFKITPDIMLSSNSGASGEYIAVKGSGFGPSSPVTLALDTTSLTNATTDAFGSFQTEFVIPQLPTLTYNLKVQDGLGNNVEVNFPVTAGATLSGSSGAVGSPVTVNGGGFSAGSTVTVYYDEKPVATATADSAGKFTITFNVPASKGGDHTIIISDNTTTRKYSYAVESTPPPVPALVLPKNSGISGAFANLQWQEVSDPSLPVTYDLQIASDSDFKNIVLEKDALTAARYTLTGSEALAVTTSANEFFWRIAAIDGASNRSAWSPSSSFYVDIPLAPVLTGPIGGTPVAFPASLTWGDVASLSQPVTYRLQVSRNAAFTQLLIDEKDVTSAAYVIPAESKQIFNKKIIYYWRVKAIDNARNAGDWSAAGTFTLAPTGFPAWAVYTLVAFGAVVLAWLVWRIRRHRSYH